MGKGGEGLDREDYIRKVFAATHGVEAGDVVFACEPAEVDYSPTGAMASVGVRKELGNEPEVAIRNADADSATESLGRAVNDAAFYRMQRIADVMGYRLRLEPKDG